MFATEKGNASGSRTLSVYCVSSIRQFGQNIMDIDETALLLCGDHHWNTGQRLSWILTLTGRDEKTFKAKVMGTGGYDRPVRDRLEADTAVVCIRLIWISVIIFS